MPNSTRMFVRRRINQENDARCLAPSFKTRSPTLMVWGAINGSGTGPLIRCTGMVNQHRYLEILQQHQHYLRQGILAQDNAPCHGTHLIRNWLSDQGIETLPWPSLSPDLNPIEHLWGIMKKRIHGMHFTSKDEMWMKLQTLWNSFDQSFVLSFIDSMPRRINARGGATKY